MEAPDPHALEQNLERLSESGKATDDTVYLASDGQRERPQSSQLKYLTVQARVFRAFQQQFSFGCVELAGEVLDAWQYPLGVAGS